MIRYFFDSMNIKACNHHCLTILVVKISKFTLMAMKILPSSSLDLEDIIEIYLTNIRHFLWPTN